MPILNPLKYIKLEIITPCRVSTMFINNKNEKKAQQYWIMLKNARNIKNAKLETHGF